MTEIAVDAAPARQHCKMLAFHRMSLTEMANLSEVPRSTIAGLMHTGERKWATIRRSTSDRICAIPVPEGYPTPNVGAAAPTEPADETAADEDLGLEQETVDAARRTVASFAEDPAELRMFLSMLGIGGQPSTPDCLGCGDPIGRATAGGYNRPARDGMCARCVNAAEKRVQREAARS